MSSAGQILGGIAGGVIGFFAQNPFLGAQIGMSLGGLIDPPKGPTTVGPRLDDLTVQTSTYGAPIPRIYGTATVVGNVIWLENNRLKETVTKKKSGGKGGGSKTTTKTYSYSATFAVALCKGPIVGIRRLWIRSDLVYDAGSSDPNTIAASNQSAAGWTLYTGTDTQAADARMQATLGVANTPAWRGLAYLVFQDLELAKYANSLIGAQIKAEVVVPQGTLTPAIISNISAATGYRGVSVLVHQEGYISGFGIFTSGPNYYAERSVASPSAADSLISSKQLPSQALYPVVIAGHPSGIIVSTVTGNNLGFFDLEANEIGARISMASPFPYWNSGPDPMCWDAASGRLMVIGTFGAGISHYASAKETSGSWDVLITYAAAPIKFTAVLSGGDGYTYATDAFLNLYRVNYAWEVIDGPWSYPANNKFLFRDGVYFYFRDTTTSRLLLEARFDNGSYTVTASATVDVGTAWAYACYTGNRTWWVRTNTSRVFLTFAGTLSARPELLSGVVASECLQSGLLSAGDIDVSALTSSVRGYRIGTIGTLRSALEPLQASWPFDVVQRGYKLTFKPRGGASVATIAAGDLDARGASQEPGVQITQTREVDNQLPRRLTVRYLDSAREYDAGSQYAERLSTTTIRETVVDLPIVLDAGEAAGKAEVLLYAAWLARMQISFNLPATYLHLEPADVVTLPTPEGSITVRLTTVNYTSDNRVECRATLERAAVYTPAALGVAPGTTGPTTLTLLGPSTYALLDLPRLGSSQDGVGFPVAMCGADSAWPGGALMRSADAGATWDQPLDFAPPGATIGVATTTIGVVESRLIDAASRLTVTLTSGTLSDVSELAMLAGANHFAYGAAGRWEIIAARSCTLQSGSTYILSNLLRGRFGSEWAMGLHATSDVVVLLDSADLQVLPLTNADIGAARLFRAITSGRDFSTDSDRAMTYAAVNLKPLSPVLLNGSRDPGTGDWSLTWTRRTRKGGEWLDGVDAELGEAAEAYDIEVYADGSYATLKRTITASSPSCAYSSADQVSDFGSNQSTLYLKVYQRSATVGRGYPLTTAITR